MSGLVNVSNKNFLVMVRFFINISEFIFFVKLLWKINVVSNVKLVVKSVVVWVRNFSRIVRLLLNLSSMVSGSRNSGMFIVFIYCCVFV